MVQAININFHQTFKPEKQYISAIVEIAADGAKSFSVKDISYLTGIPNGQCSGKVEPHIYYANYMGLINFEKKDGNYCLSRTMLGESVCIEDLGLQESLTILICHCMMLRAVSGAPLWAKIFKTIFPKYKNGIKKEMLLKELEIMFDGKVNTKNIAPFYGSYDSFFSSLELLHDDGESIKITSLSYNKEYIYVYAYILITYWDELFLDQDEITSNQLDELFFGNVFGWNKQEEYEVLEQLSDYGIIRMNRQLMPYTILKLTSKDELIAKLYSELC